MLISDLIKNKGFEVIAVDADIKVSIAISKMVDRNIGALLVIEDGREAGMFTERDVLKCWAKTASFDIPIKDAMTRNLIVARLDEDVSYAMGIMIQSKIRHLPVIDARGKVVSVLSIRDVVNAQVTKLETEVHHLVDYMSDKYPG